MTEPVVKWPGGKRQLLSELVSKRPLDYNSYHEPFFGGGALFFELEPDSGSINDANIRLINMYKQVRDNVEELIQKLKNFKRPNTTPDPSLNFSQTKRNGEEISNYYYQQRERFNNRPNNEEYDKIEEAALFLYLNRTCYNGVYRENSSGEFNTPQGGYTNPDWVQQRKLRKASSSLQDITIQCGDYSYITDKANNNDFVYFDPPYSERSGHDYTGDAWSGSKQNELIEIMKELREKGVYCMVSNSIDMKEQYSNAGFTVVELQADRAINQDGEGRNQSFGEVIATTYNKNEWYESLQKELTDF